MFSITRARLALLFLAPLAPLGAQGTGAQKIIAYVNSRDILNAAPAASTAQAVLQREGAGMQAEVQKMSDALDALTAAFNKEQATLSGEKREARIKAITDKQAESQQRYQQMQQIAQDREAEVMQPILDQIKLAIEDVRVELGYSVIFDIGQSGALVAADKNLNISDRVIAKLRTMPVPVIAERSTGATKASDPKAASKSPAGGPVSAPAGIGSKAAPPATKRPDSTAKADSTKKDSVPPRRPPPAK
jgi:Skp family chaperone for outer membrane proteins